MEYHYSGHFMIPFVTRMISSDTPRLKMLDIVVHYTNSNYFASMYFLFFDSTKTPRVGYIQTLLLISVPTLEIWKREIDWRNQEPDRITPVGKCYVLVIDRNQTGFETSTSYYYPLYARDLLCLHLKTYL
jgi:hypothetical protein